MRIGFCCKVVSPTGSAEWEKRLNMRTTTLAALRRLDRSEVRTKLTAIAEHNMAALGRQVEFVAARPPLERCLRISSDMFPAYSHPLGSWVYKERSLVGRMETVMAGIGHTARTHGVRLSLHPGQFCVLNSGSPETMANSVAELEYHTDILRFLGHAGGWHPLGAHINIHGGSRSGGIEGFRRGLALLSQEARDLLTVENDEVSFGLDDLLPLAEEVPIVLDIHHHWIRSGGEYISPDDPRVERVKASWRGVRPVAHVSVSREDLLAPHSPIVRPDFLALLARGITPRDLRGHSDRMWNDGINELVLAHLVWADFEVEAKKKNLAVDDLAQHIGRSLAKAPAA